MELGDKKMNEKLNDVISKLVEIEYELDELYENGEVDMAFIKGKITEARFRLEAASQTIARSGSWEVVSDTQ